MNNTVWCALGFGVMYGCLIWIDEFQNDFDETWTQYALNNLLLTSLHLKQLTFSLVRGSTILKQNPSKIVPTGAIGF